YSIRIVTGELMVSCLLLSSRYDVKNDLVGGVGWVLRVEYDEYLTGALDHVAFPQQFPVVVVRRVDKRPAHGRSRDGAWIDDLPGTGSVGDRGLDDDAVAHVDGRLAAGDGDRIPVGRNGNNVDARHIFCDDGCLIIRHGRWRKNRHTLLPATPELRLSARGG